MKTIIKLIALFAAATAWADDSIMAENAGDYRRTVDEVIREFRETGRIPTINKALRIQACENDMLALARLDPSLARRMPPLLLANHAKLDDLRHLPGELIAGRAKEAGVDVLKSAVAGQTFTYKKGKLFRRTKKFFAGQVTSEYPAKGDWRQAHAYAESRLAAGEYELAAKQFTEAARINEAVDGTRRKVWEFENHLSAAWAWMLEGRPDKARASLAIAQGLEVEGPPSTRARYLDAVLTGEVHPSLSMNLKDTLVRR